MCPTRKLGRANMLFCALDAGTYDLAVFGTREDGAQPCAAFFAQVAQCGEVGVTKNTWKTPGRV